MILFEIRYFTNMFSLIRFANEVHGAAGAIFLERYGPFLHFPPEIRSKYSHIHLNLSQKLSVVAVGNENSDQVVGWRFLEQIS